MATPADYVRENRPRHLEELQDLLRIPSISTQPDKAPEVRRAAEWVRSRLLKAGCTQAELHDTEGHPIVYGQWMGAPGRPTVLVYGHYDVQPVDPLDEWKSPPFEPAIRDGRIYARGASDDKGQIVIHMNALEAHLQTTGTCPVNVKFVIEGEEEVGSRHLESYLKARRKDLAFDTLVVSDTAMYEKGLPSICVGLRGLTYLQVDVQGTSSDLHSGTFGGAVINPAFALARMIAALKDDRGKVRVPGFYDRVRKLTAAERKAFGALRHSDAKFKKSLGAPALFGEAGYTTLERMWARPTLEINGIWGGYLGEGAKTVIPAVAHAKISTRLVPDQNPAEIARKLEAHLKKIAPKAVKVTVRNLHSGDGWVTSTDHPALRAAGRAVKRVFGRQPVFIREGGSIPVVASFDRIFKVPAVLLGIGLHDDNLHAPNEKLEIENFEKGNEVAACLMEELGRG